MTLRFVCDAVIILNESRVTSIIKRRVMLPPRTPLHSHHLKRISPLLQTPLPAASASPAHSSPRSVTDDDGDAASVHDDAEEQPSLQAAISEAAESLRTARPPKSQQQTHRISRAILNCVTFSIVFSSPLTLIFRQVCAAIDDIDRAQQHELEAIDRLIRVQAGMASFLLLSTLLFLAALNTSLSCCSQHFTASFLLLSTL